ncbi:hypothetical protein TWF506_002541 [Arthrobotrys conoides]|uniref:Alpha-ketoglutarate-dependent dioxygenase AlkB-like domain-containing protein n=1 Tax=Arthrobotrys conoides TaxID=74498 RepID=A0AAN8RRJ2_9PEZI
MALDRKGSRSSRRLQGVAPEPPSPPESERGDPPLDLRPRQARTHRVSIRNLTGLVSPPLSAREPTQKVLLPGGISTTDRMVTRRQASIAQGEVASIEAPVAGANSRSITRRSKRFSDTNSIGEPILQNTGEAGSRRKRASRTPSVSEAIASNINAQNVPAALPLPPRGIITKRRATNPPCNSSSQPTIKEVNDIRQTRSSKRKAEFVEDAAEPVNPQGNGAAEQIQNTQPKRQKLELRIVTPAESKVIKRATNPAPAERLHTKNPSSAVAAPPHRAVDPIGGKRSTTARKNSKVPQIPAATTPEKPPAIGKPAVWCDTRQELCESLPAFRSYQGGCYASKGFGRGYLIDGHASERDYMDGSVIISHAGGNSEEVEGERRLVRDQTWDKGVIAYLRNNCEQMVPLIVIIGERCPTAPAHLEHRYAVLDWFKVTHCWPEKDSKSGNIRCKFRLEKLDSSKQGWWAAADTPKVSEDIAIEYINCPSCRQNSPWIYDNEPMCLNKDCKRFWTVHSGRGGKAPQNFIYRKSFLHGTTVWPDAATISPGPLGPNLPIEDEITESHGRDVKRKFWKGMWCQNCGKLNCRELWKSWKCTNCDWEVIPKRSHFVPADLSDQHRPEYTGPPIPENVVDSSIKSESIVLPDGRRAMLYDVFQCGKVIHILANTTWNALPGGPNWLLDHYQDVDIPFKRHELKTHKLTGRLLTQQFSFNSGAPYKYIVEVDSLSFEQSPQVVRQALDTLQTDVTRMIPEALPMNEVLNVAYFEEQKMDFHDDGEEDLGPCVSSISLGSPAMMYFRVKAKYCNGTLSDTDKALLQPSKPSHSGSSTPEESKRPSKRNILELRLHHGDVVIMNGRPIQRLLEHAVTPEGFRIAATARNISSYNAVLNSKDVKSKRVGERKNTSITRDDGLKAQDGAEDPLVLEDQANSSPSSVESGTLIKSIDAAEFEKAQEEGREKNTKTSLYPQMEVQISESHLTQANEQGLSHLPMPQYQKTPGPALGKNVSLPDNRLEIPLVHGSSSPSVLAPSPTSSLSTPDFTYYNINAASATPTGSVSGFNNTYTGSNVYEEPISPLTISNPRVGNYMFESAPGEPLRATLGTEADPRTLIRPMVGMEHHRPMASPQVTGTMLNQVFMGPQLTRHEEMRAPIPPPFGSAPNWGTYGGQAAVRAAEGVERSDLPGWSSEQFRKLQNIFLSGNSLSAPQAGSE